MGAQEAVAITLGRSDKAARGQRQRIKKCRRDNLRGKLGSTVSRIWQLVGWEGEEGREELRVSQSFPPQLGLTENMGRSLAGQ